MKQPQSQPQMQAKQRNHPQCGIRFSIFGPDHPNKQKSPQQQHQNRNRETPETTNQKNWIEQTPSVPYITNEQPKKGNKKGIRPNKLLHFRAPLGTHRSRTIG